MNDKFFLQNQSIDKIQISRSDVGFKIYIDYVYLENSPQNFNSQQCHIFYLLRKQVVDTKQAISRSQLCGWSVGPPEYVTTWHNTRFVDPPRYVIAIGIPTRVRPSIYFFSVQTPLSMVLPNISVRRVMM